MATQAALMTTVVAEPLLSHQPPAGAVVQPLLARPPQPRTILAPGVFAWRAMLKIKHVPMQLFDVTALPIMFVLLFTYLFGGALAARPRVPPVPAPGILVMTVILITMYTGMALNTDIRKGLFDRSGRCRSGGRRLWSGCSSPTPSATRSPR